MYAPGPHELQTHGVTAESFEALADIALASLSGKHDLSIVCGPISTGGTNNQTYNFQIFNATIRGLEGRGVNLFNQVPYEYGLRKLAHQWDALGNTGYCLPILTTFYARVFASGKITQGWFIPGWRSSFGARWEREKLSSHGCVIHDFTRHELKAFLEIEYPADHVDQIVRLIPSEP